MEGAGPTECPVGSIVWVRRRNGSWWPGKILGPEELPASHLTSPRTGTPVKLLGREDASVDWYNLEKSKRVKAFRCGEFDDSIERAEAAQGMPPKKREKYARREDAILHALELEKEMLLKQGKLEICHEQVGGKSSGSVGKDSGDSDNNNGDLRNPKLDELLITQHTLDKGEALPDLLASEKNYIASHGEITPRMRGLEELGLKTTTEHRKLPSLFASDNSLKFAVSDTEVPHSREPSLERASHMNGKTSLDKRKRSHDGLSEEILMKKRDRSRPLVQVLQNSAKLEGPHTLQPDLPTVSNSLSGEQMGGVYRSKRSRYVYLPAEFSDASDDKEMHPNRLEMSPSQLGECNSYPFSGHLVEDGPCEFMDNLDSGASGSTSSDTQSESDSSETEPDLDEEMTSVSGGAVPMEVELDTFGRDDAFEEGGSISTGESNESSLSGDLPHFYPHDPLSGNEAVSKWQLKGKRNIRSLAKRTMDANAKSINRSIHGIYQEEKGARRMASIDNVGYPQTFKTLPRGRNSFSSNGMESRGMSWETQAALRRHWETTRHFNPVFVGHHRFGGRVRPMLIDVDLRVQASYQKPPVPIVSLMSKLDGKAIIGHPIQIEPLEDGTSERLVPPSSYLGNGLVNHDGSTSLPPTWRTARRTNFRVPRLHLPSALASDETAEDHSFDRDRPLQFKRINAGSSDVKTGAVRKNMSSKASGDPRLQRKLPKKVSSSSTSLKTKALSSIVLEHNTSSKAFHGSSNSGLGMILKPESAGPPTVACIPVKLVFSRLLEKINRPPSKPMQFRGN